MNNNQAYLPPTIYFPNSKVVADSNILPISLIAYDKVYIHSDLENLPWDLADSIVSTRKGRKFNPAKYKKRDFDEPVDVSQMNLAILLDGNPKNLKLLSKHLIDIKKHPNPEVTEFFYLSFESLRGFGTQMFHLYLLPLLDSHFTNELHFDWDDVIDRHFSYVLNQEVFVSSILSKNFGFDVIQSLNDIELKMAILHMPPIPINMAKATEKYTGAKVNFDKKPNLLDKYVKSRTIQAMLRNQSSNRRKVKDIKLILDLSVPNFSEVPISEIARLKAKDKLKSIAEIAHDIREKAKSTSSLDFAKIFSDHLWKIGKTFSPSISDILVGVIGEIPLPLPVSPIGIISSLNDIQQYIKFKQEYQWFISISELRKHGEKAG